VSRTISHRSELQTFLRALASLCRKTTMSSGSNATTKSASSRLMDTLLRGDSAAGKDDLLSIDQLYATDIISEAYRLGSLCRSIPSVFHRPREEIFTFLLLLLPLGHKLQQTKNVTGMTTASPQKSTRKQVTLLASLEVCCLVRTSWGFGGGVSGDIRGPPSPSSLRRVISTK